MKPLSSILRMFAGIAGLVLIVLGLLIWLGRMYQFLPLHIGVGVLLVLALWVQAWLASRSGASLGLVVFAVAWGVLMPLFGMTHANLLPGDAHWVIRVLHLAVGIVGMRLVDVLGKHVRGGAAAESRGGRTAPPRVQSHPGTRA